MTVPDARAGGGPTLIAPKAQATPSASPDSRAPRAPRPSITPSSSPSPTRRPAGGGWSFLPFAPLVVVVVGLAVALGIGLVGLDHLARAGDEHAGARAELLAATVAARLSQLPPDRRLEATQLAARRSFAEILLVTPDARVVHDATFGPPDRGALG